MRILVYEFVSGGGLAGQAVPASLAREGAAMRGALVEDLATIGCHQIVATADPRFPLKPSDRVEVVTLFPERRAVLETLLASADAIWLVAPETDYCLERLAATVERMGKPLVGPGSVAIRGASDKAALPQLLASRGLAHPKTFLCGQGTDLELAAGEVGYPLVVKPRRGAGCVGVGFARRGADLRRAVDAARGAKGDESLLLQRYIAGVPASVSLVADGRRAVALALNAQWIRPSPFFSYRGGTTPLDHPLAARAFEAAQDTCRAFPGLRGYVGVDLVLTESEVVVIEVNPRLTTAYLGLRLALDENLAALTLAACGGTLPAAPVVCRRIRFTASGRILSNSPRSDGS